MFRRRQLRVEVVESFFQLANALTHGLYFVMKLLGVGEDESNGLKREWVGERQGVETDLEPLPPVSAPSGQISAQPLLQQDWHGKTRSH